MYDFEDFETDLFFEQLNTEAEIITERAVLFDQKSGFSIHSTPDIGRNLGEPSGYFKWVNHTDFSKATEIARIRFSAPIYEVHNTPGKTTIKLNSSQKKKMIKLLEDGISSKNYRYIPDDLKRYISTNWQYLIYMYNIDCGVDPKLLLKHLDMSEPVENLPDKLVRLTLPMPDYTLL